MAVAGRWLAVGAVTGACACTCAGARGGTGAGACPSLAQLLKILAVAGRWLDAGAGAGACACAGAGADAGAVACAGNFPVALSWAYAWIACNSSALAFFIISAILSL